MKKLLNILFLFVATKSFCTNYYVSAAGSDANPGTSPSAAWQTIAKATSWVPAPGDSILFRRGDIFYGTLTISTSGNSTNHVVYGAYGTGTNPIITGFTNVTAWTNLGGNIWESTNAVSTLSTCNMVSINGINTAMGRFPNNGFVYFARTNGTSYVSSDTLSGAPNWTGGDIIIRKSRYVLEKGTVTNQIGDSIAYTSPNVYTATVGWGFFIQNDSLALDTLNEWYYNPTSKKIRIYSLVSPINVNVATVTNNVNITGAYITIQNLCFTGSNGIAISSGSGSNIIFQNCIVSYSGQDGFNTSGSTNVMISGCKFYYCNDNGIKLGSSCKNSTVTNDTLQSIGILPGMTQTYSYGSISVSGDSSLVQYNNIDSSGYNGITFNGKDVKVLNNFINHSCVIKDDGGGIYSSQSNSGRQISGNIILNSIGTAAGSNNPGNQAYGLYLDSYSSNFLVNNNTVSGCAGPGGFFSDLDSNIINNNTFYNNSLASGFDVHSNVLFQYICCNNVTKNTFNNNILITKITGLYSMFTYAVGSSITAFVQADSNYYVNPTTNDLFYADINGTYTSYTFPNWKTYSTWGDSHSKDTTLSTTTLSNLNFIYNATQSAVTTTLPYNYVDIKGNDYNGSITLQPYTSAVLIQNGAIISANVSQTLKLYCNCKFQ